MARRLVGPVGALVAILIIDGLHYFTFTAPKFNHDVVQLPFWALAGYSYWAALRHGRIAHWLLLGFAIGMALWAKYFVVVLVAPLALFALLDRDARRSLATPGPWIAAAAAVVVMAPHLLWLVQNGFPAVRLCRSAGSAVLGLARISDQAAGVPVVAIGVPGAVAADRGALPAPGRAGRRPARAGRRRFRPPHRRRSWRSGRR